MSAEKNEQQLKYWRLRTIFVGSAFAVEIWVSKSNYIFKILLNVYNFHRTYTGSSKNSQEYTFIWRNHFIEQLVLKNFIQKFLCSAFSSTKF